MPRTILLVVYFFCFIYGKAQVCPNPGQNPFSAFPVCALDTFYQSVVPLCSGTLVPTPACGTFAFEDRNPYYYKFTCFQSGALYFTIKPNVITDDYDWSLYDVTGANLADIYINEGLTIASNFSGSSGNTGMSTAGTTRHVCTGDTLWSRPVGLVPGHQYLLLVSHYTDTQSGYSLYFGGNAVISDSTTPSLVKAIPNCNGDMVSVLVSKKILCQSIAADASDFYITPGSITINAASAINCSSGFDADTVQLFLNAPLTAGNYTVHVKNGTDANTLLDNCGSPLPTTAIANFSFTAAQPSTLDSIAPITCEPTDVFLEFPYRPIKCNSIAANGSDFSITGPYPVNIIAASPNTCINGVTESIKLTLDRTLNKKGVFTITLKTGTDGNTIINECNQQSPVGSSKNFMAKDTVTADYAFQLIRACLYDTLRTLHNGANDVNKWYWYLNDTITNITTPNATFPFYGLGEKRIGLIVSNGACADTISKTFNLGVEEPIQAAFEIFPDNCPNELLNFTSTSIGNNLTYLWQFGDGFTATKKDTTHIYPAATVHKSYTVTHTVKNLLGCKSTVSKTINIAKQCGEYIPSAFTPNGDGVNDSFGMLYITKSSNLVFRVYNRWGYIVFETTDWRQAWDGKIKGLEAPVGTYIWSLRYTNRDNGKVKQNKGTVVLIR
jgi:gliding motility-associated-like protein